MSGVSERRGLFDCSSAMCLQASLIGLCLAEVLQRKLCAFLPLGQSLNHFWSLQALTQISNHQRSEVIRNIRIGRNIVSLNQQGQSIPINKRFDQSRNLIEGEQRLFVRSPFLCSSLKHEFWLPPRSMNVTAIFRQLSTRRQAPKGAGGRVRRGPQVESAASGQLASRFSVAVRKSRTVVALKQCSRPDDPSVRRTGSWGSSVNTIAGIMRGY